MATNPQTEHDCYCAQFHYTAELLGRRWSAVVLRVLTQGPIRFSHIRRHIPGISDRLLTKRLAELVDEGIVLRCEKDGDACYALSDRGLKFLPALDAIDAVAHEVIPAPA